MLLQIHPTGLLIGAVLFLTCSLTANEQLVELKQTTDRWVELRTRLAEEKTTWNSEKEVLKTSIQTLNANVSSIDESLQFYDNSIEELRNELNTAKQDEAKRQATTDQIAQQVETYEDRIQSMSTRLPDPLKDKIKPLLSKIPKDPENTLTPLANRMQNVVAIMTTIDEFNQSLTLSRSVRALDSEQSIEVRALYWGLSYGIATNTSGNKAWLIKPDKDTWQWIDYNDNAAAVNEIFLVYDKKADPEIVTIPFQTDH
ncbi:DUF3450 family protein [Pelagicoccus sp. SDUM812002]|uniref:DUF3450 family protein n=1 Tax=Pelagicoccus sp. SDUM812002 TaxID=3041266 RepID=UPI00280F1AE4|nr:DUF3450 family protein [Pelagicoccus sp. SDUM812002]MDQ8186339.1 DUF3450 family protein [Pelagicoccus sp. SDUM812002]